MNAIARRLAGSILAALGTLILSAGTAVATDDYSLPFYNPSVALSYGVDRDATLNRQLDWTGQTWYDGAAHYGRVYDQHSGLDYPMSLRSDVAAARDGTVIDTESGYGTQQFGDFGNFVLIEHADGRRTLYYHLASAADGGVTVAVGQSVLAGQRVARSGCSGHCFGAHLHFELRTWSSAKGRWVSTDPLAERRWTTWPGRVPFLAAWVRENNDGTEVVRQGQTITHWVEFRNSGGRTWRSTGLSGRIVLATWDPALRASAFRAVDWPSSWLATLLDTTTVSPDGVGRFTFGIKGTPSPGSYVEDFNLYAQDLRWFDYARLGSFHVPIVVSNVTP